VIAARVRPRLRPLVLHGLEALLRRVQTGACEAAVAVVGRLGPALGGRRNLSGPVAGGIERGTYAIALERGSALKPSIDGAVRRLAANGSLRRLARAWLRLDAPRLRVLR
jgi:ABC-type amino acid transport substrate-binding protein